MVASDTSKLEAMVAKQQPQIQECQAEIKRLKQELLLESRLRSLEEGFEQLKSHINK